jgi:hypothetical protein
MDFCLLRDHTKNGILRKELNMKKTLTIFAVLMLVSFSIFATVSAHNDHGPTITLSPPQGFAMTMIAGTGFDECKTISISYDGVVQTTVPLAVKTDSNGCFTAIISIPNELAVGVHTITATQSHGDSASSTFTVVDMKGPQGVQGIAGTNGKDGANGINGVNGLNGINGINGQDGINGINGQDFNATGNVLVYNGTDGLNGAAGANGINGVNGINGKDGTNGLNGADGTNGINGINGINGVNGINGKDGTNGAQGPAGSQGLQSTTQPIVVTEPTPTNALDFQSFLAIIVIALIAFTAAMLAIYRKSNH